MINLLLDIAPWPRSGNTPRIREVLGDTIDTIAAPVQQVTDSAAPGGHNNLGIILVAILAALIALGICIFMVRASRKRGEQQLQFSGIKS